MTDIEKTREEVERLINELIQERGKYYSSDVDDACILELQNVLTYIDSLQEEPKQCMYSKDHYTDEDRKALCDGCEEECEYSKKEEPVDEDLDKAAVEWFNSVKYKSDLSATPINAFKAGAKWQEKQDQETIELAEDHAMLAGMEKMKEQMMKDAVETSVCALPNGLNVIIEPEYLKEYRFGEKVKVIVIKED